MARRRYTHMMVVPVEQRRPRNWAAYVAIGCGLAGAFVIGQIFTFVLAVIGGGLLGGVVYSTLRRRRRPPTW